MNLWVCLLFSCLLSISLQQSSIDSIRVQPDPHVDRPASWFPVGLRHRPGGVKAGEELTAKLLRLDDLVRMENDVLEPKRKRNFPGKNAPLDRLSVSFMDTKSGANNPSKVVALPRRRVNVPPIDRIGMSRLPNSRRLANPPPPF